MSGFTARLIVCFAAGLALLGSSVADAANQAPTATITSPANGISLNAPATITLTAAANDPDGTVASVQFFSGATTVGPVLTSAPYSYTWTNVAAGAYSITAKPIDNLGKAGTSNTVQVSVVPITTFINSPAAGATVTAGSVQVTGTFSGPTTSTILVTAGANDTVMANVGTGTFSAYVEVVEGPNTIEVQVARPDGTSQVVTSTVNGVARPVVAITGPALRGPYPVGTTVSITAEAATGQGTVSKVEFRDNSSLFDTATTPPYTVSRTLTTSGSHSIVARAYNSANLMADSAPLVLNATSQPPAVAITAPAGGSSFKAGTAITVTASASDPDGTVERVDYLFSTNPTGSTTSPYTATWTPLSAGSYQLVARARDNSGLTTDSAPVAVTITANEPPAVELTSPASNVNAFAPASVSLAATATDVDGIGKVEFFLATGTILSTDTVAPYQYDWTNIPAGTYVVAARAFDTLGGVSTSASRTITVTAPPPNQPPTVTLTSPANNATFTAPVDVTLSATASDPDTGGSIAKVEFLDGTTVLATITTPPYQYVWSNPALGAHTVAARATDNLGATTTASASITVDGSVVAITQPPNGFRVAAPASYNIVGSVSTTTGTITTAEILDGQTVIATATVNLPAASFSFLYSNVPAGTHVHTIRAMHSNGSTVLSAPVSVEVYTPPSVTLGSPAQNEFFIAPAAVGIVATPTGFANPISRVQFFAGAQQIGEATIAPYEMLWNNVATGTYQIRATATDSAGTVASSAIGAITVASAPVLQITAGQDGSSVADDKIYLSGHVDAPANTAVLVNDRVATIDGNGNWFMNAVRLAPGPNTITITAKAIGAADVTQSISVSSTAVQPFELIVSPQEGLPPLIVNASVRQRGALPMARVEFDADSNGTSDATVTQLEGGQARAAFSYGTTGIYTFTARVYDVAGNVIYTASRGVFVTPAGLAANRVLTVYRSMVGRLLNGDAAGAATVVAEETREKYRAAFDALGLSMSSVATQLGQLEARALSDEIAELVVLRDTPQGRKAFPIQLIKSADGLWRIEGM